MNGNGNQQGELFGSTEEVIASLRIQNQCHRKTTKGTHCVVCDQKSKEYHRPMYGTQARRLIRLFRRVADTNTTAHVKEFISSTGADGDFAKLVHWGLIWPGEERGFWGITVEGIEFVKLLRKIPKRAILYNEEFLGFDEDTYCDILEVLGKKFDYDELMSR